MHWAPFLAAVAFLLAGCGSPGDDPSPDDEIFGPPPPVALGKGIIRGLVVTSAIAPVEGATIQANGVAEPRRSDENGAFVFTDLDPGLYFLTASKPGWSTVQLSAEVVADVEEPDIVKVLIDRIPGTEPRADTYSRDGYISCSIGTPVSFTDCNTIEEQQAHLTFPIVGEPDWMQTEVVWESTQALGEWLYIIQGICDCEDGFGDRFDETANATSPYIVRVDDGVFDVDDEAGDGIFYVVEPSASGPEPELTNGSGIALNQRFSVYVTLFYNLEPAEDWSFTEDGPYPVPPG